MSNSFSHLDENGQPGMVDVSAKNETVREARAQSIVYLGKEVAGQLSEAGWQPKKEASFKPPPLQERWELKKHQT